MVNKGQFNFIKYENIGIEMIHVKIKIIIINQWLQKYDLFVRNEKYYTFKITTEVACLSSIDSSAFFS